jgi:hypothetical protein
MPDKKKPEDPVLRDRGENIATKKKIKDDLLDKYKDIVTGFTDQNERSQNAQSYWKAFNGELSDNQFYSGNSQLFVPAIYNAIEARVTRFTNQIFPVSGQHVEVMSSDVTKPQAIMSLLEHYIRKAKLRSLIPSLIRNGDVEGQYNIYVSWSKRVRHVVRKIKRQSQEGVGDIEDIEEEELTASRPEVEILADSDVLVLPSTADSIEEAIYEGGSATILRRWTKAKIKEMMASDAIDSKAGEILLDEMQQTRRSIHTPDKEKDAVHAAGIKSDGRGKWALVYEVWLILKLEEGLRVCQAFFGGPDNILMCRRNPLWCDRVPLLSHPVKKIQGSFKGQSLVKPILDMQIYINDVANEGADSSYYALLPIVMSDPEKNPRVASMVLAPAAVWETNPRDTQFAQFPPLWQDAMELVQMLQGYIFQTLGVNPAMITGNQKQKRNQAEIANEQQVDILTTADVVTVLEAGILTPLVQLFVELDHQNRDEKISVRRFGEMGMSIDMEQISPVQMGYRYEYRWFGVEAARSAQQIQQQISALNVARGIPPQLYQGYKLNLAPAMTHMIGNTFGPQLGRQIFEDLRAQISVDPQIEDDLMDVGNAVPVHPLDDHRVHIEVHSQDMQQRGDRFGTKRAHLADHMQQVAQQAQQQMGPPQQPPGQPGGPGGGGKGMPGQAKPGASPGQPRPMQQPPGAVAQDQMRDPRAMPRRM